MAPGFGWVAVSFAALNSSAAGRPMERSKVTMRSLVEWEMVEISPINVDDGWMDDGWLVDDWSMCLHFCSDLMPLKIASQAATHQ